MAVFGWGGLRPPQPKTACRTFKKMQFSFLLPQEVGVCHTSTSSIGDSGSRNLWKLVEYSRWEAGASEVAFPSGSLGTRGGKLELLKWRSQAGAWVRGAGSWSF
jgi:hypothetical protein